MVYIYIYIYIYSDQGVVLVVIERLRVRLPAGTLPSSLDQLSLPSLRGM